MSIANGHNPAVSGIAGTAKKISGRVRLVWGGWREIAGWMLLFSLLVRASKQGMYPFFEELFQIKVFEQFWEVFTESWPMCIAGLVFFFISVPAFKDWHDSPRDDEKKLMLLCLRFFFLVVLHGSGDDGAPLRWHLPLITPHALCTRLQ